MNYNSYRFGMDVHDEPVPDLLEQFFGLQLERGAAGLHQVIDDGIVVGLVVHEVRRTLRRRDDLLPHLLAATLGDDQVLHRQQEDISELKNGKGRRSETRTKRTLGRK